MKKKKQKIGGGNFPKSDFQKMKNKLIDIIGDNDFSESDFQKMKNKLIDIGVIEVKNNEWRFSAQFLEQLAIALFNVFKKHEQDLLFEASLVAILRLKPHLNKRKLDEIAPYILAMLESSDLL